MADQPHARLYRGLPAVHETRRHWWLIAGAVLVAAVALGAVVIFVRALLDQGDSGPGSFGAVRPDLYVAPLFTPQSFLWMGGALVVGAVLGHAYAQGWWRMVAVDAVGLAIAVGLALEAASGFDKGLHGWFLWFFWVVGVSVGAGVRRWHDRRRVLKASYVGRSG